MVETMQTSKKDGHFNESIVNEEILEDMKKNRIDHMKYLPDMEQLEESDVMDQVISAMKAYDYDKYTEADVRRALAHDNRTPEDFQALLSPAALPLLEEIAQQAQIETRKHFGNSVYMFTPIYIANYCENYCIYCGFNCHNKIRRAQLNGEEIEKELKTVEWDAEAAEKSGYEHFMIKEIHEQPTAITRTITPRIKDSLPCFEDDNIPDSFFEDISDITVVACGTAMYAGMVGKALLKNKFGIPVSVEIASEFRYEQPVLTDRSMVIFVSQSGETIDTLEALRLANKYTKKTLSIVNVKGSTIARESNYVLYTHAGPEIAVASTKAYTVQVASFYLIGCKLGLVSGRMTKEEAKTFIENLQEVPNLIESVITQAPEIEQLTKRMTNATNAFYIGRGLDYALSMEGALKLKEISYIHAEAYAAGELKHGTIALISEGVPVIAVATQSHVYSKVISNIREVKARGAYVILLSKDKDITDKSICDVHISLPQAPDEFVIFESVIICQLIAYYTSTGKGLNPDQPRNLAKSVTVE